jgi:homogentisate solanesyltransferase
VHTELTAEHARRFRSAPHHLIALAMPAAFAAAAPLRGATAIAGDRTGGCQLAQSARAAPPRIPAAAAHRRVPGRRTALAPRASAAPSPTPAPMPVPVSTPARGGALGALHRFTRPHTVRGTVLASVAGVARALADHPAGPAIALDPRLVPRAALGMLALVLGNAFIVGINQIYDVAIDRVNKPFLPLAAGHMSARAAWAVVVASALAGLAIVRLCFSRLIFGLYAFGMAVGALYSVPPFRFKRFPALAAITISCVRGFLLNFGVYHATGAALGRPFIWSPPITFLAVFMSIFACVIALAKDLPDIRGDVAGGVPTFASKAGAPAIIRVVLALLAINYAGAIATAFLAPATAFRTPVLVIGHAVLGSCLAMRARSIDPNNQQSVKSFYAFIWTLFYAEYILFPFI